MNNVLWHQGVSKYYKIFFITNKNLPIEINMSIKQNSPKKKIDLSVKKINKKELKFPTKISINKFRK